MDNSIDQQFIEFVVKSLVGNPDAVKVERRIDEKGVLLELTVDPEDLGRVIGKRGATAQSLRTLLRALGTKNDARYNLKIVDNGEPQDRPSRSMAANNDNATSGTATGTQVADDDVLARANELKDDGMVDEDHEFVSKADSERENELKSDRVSQTRRELEELDDLDV